MTLIFRIRSLDILLAFVYFSTVASGVHESNFLKRAPRSSPSEREGSGEDPGEHKGTTEALRSRFLRRSSWDYRTTTRTENESGPSAFVQKLQRERRECHCQNAPAAASSEESPSCSCFEDDRDAVAPGQGRRPFAAVPTGQGQGQALDVPSLLFSTVVTRTAVDGVLAQWDAEIVAKDAATAKLVQKMTDAELDAIILGAGWPGGYVGATKPVKSLGWDGLMYQDGPQGYRTTGYPRDPDPGTMHDVAIQMPACGSVPYSWDTEHATVYGVLMGKVFGFHDAHVILGPGAQLVHHPRNGRNFEYAGQEDPCLGGRMVESLARGYTSQGCLATLKHYLYNDWETGRGDYRTDVYSPMEASMELYVRPFVAGLSAGAQVVMCAYNQVESQSSCGNEDLLGWLTQLGRRFFIMTDWGVPNTRDATDAAAHLEHGLTQEQPGNARNPANMKHPEKARRELKQAAAHRILAAAEDGRQFSDNAWRRKGTPHYHKTNKGKVPPADVREEWRSVAKQLTADAMVLLKNDNNMLPLQPTDRLAVNLGECGDQVKWFFLSGGGSGTVGLQKQVYPAEAVDQAAERGLLRKGKGGYTLTCRSSWSEEGDGNRHEDDQKRDYRDKGDIDAKTIVFVSAPGQVPLGQLLKAGAIVYSLYPGQMAGHALVDLLTGVYNFNGKLAASFFRDTADYNPDPHEYKGKWFGEDGLSLGYRRHMAKKDPVLFWFGFGLPYVYPGAAAGADGVGGTSSSAGSAERDPWADLVTVDVKRMDLAVRGIYFCVTSKVPPTAQPRAPHQKAVLTPSPVVQFFAQKKGRDFPELLAFRKIRELQPGATACRVAFYDPVHVWVRDQGRGKHGGQFVDQERDEWELLMSLNGPQLAKPVKTLPPAMVVTPAPATGSPAGTTTVKKYPALIDVFRALRERHAAELLLSRDAAHGRALEPVFLADKVDDAEVVALWRNYLKRANRSPIKTIGTKLSYGVYRQPGMWNVR